MYDDTPSPIFYSNFSVEVKEELTKHTNKNFNNYCEDHQTLTKPCFFAWNLSAYLGKLLKGYVKNKTSTSQSSRAV